MAVVFLPQLDEESGEVEIDVDDKELVNSDESEKRQRAEFKAGCDQLLARVNEIETMQINILLTLLTPDDNLKRVTNSGHYYFSHF